MTDKNQKIERILYIKKDPLPSFLRKGSTLEKKRRRPTLPLSRSTIGAHGLNCSVRNGKRWNPGLLCSEWEEVEPRRYNRLNYITTCGRKQQTSTLETVIAQPEPDKTNKGKGRTETNKHSGKWRAISNARLWCRHLYTCILSTSSSATALKEI